MSKKIFIFIVATVLFWGAKTLAYQMLEPLPGIGAEVNNFGDYLSGAFKLAMSLSLVLAVFQISRGGVTYMTAESIFKKGDAKKLISQAFWGLLLLFSAYLILKTINPDLVNTNFGIKSVGHIQQTNIIEITEEDPPASFADDDAIISGINPQDNKTKETSSEDDLGTINLADILPQTSYDTLERIEKSPTAPCPEKNNLTLSARDLNNGICYYKRSQ